MTQKSFTNSHLETRFKHIWSKVAPDIELIEQLSKCIPGRKYVYDFYVPIANLLIECNGGTYMRGNSGHSSGTGISRDADKVNLAQFNGFYIFVLTSDKITEDYLNDIVNFCRAKATNN